MNKEEIIKGKIQIKNKWFETKEDELDIALNVIDDLIVYINQLETNRDEAIEYLDKIVFDEYGVMYDNGSTILEYEHDFRENLLSILERGKE